jgi:hypothetical protein
MCSPKAEDGWLGVAIWARGELEQEKQPLESRDWDLGRVYGPTGDWHMDI